MIKRSPHGRAEFSGVHPLVWKIFGKVLKRTLIKTKMGMFSPQEILNYT